MNKANKARVLSEGTRGHEIQSLTLAKTLCRQQQITQIRLSAPWDWLLPRLLPGIGAVLKPQLQDETDSDFIITTGRRMAGAARWLRKHQNTQAKYIQILNPGHHFKGFDVVLLPEHDQVHHNKVICFRGNLHPFNQAWFSAHRQVNSTHKPHVAIFIGNPGDNYFEQQFLSDLKQIRSVFNKARIHLCGSPRLKPKTQRFIRSIIKAEEQLWLNHTDGDNPYGFLLANADKIFVTADSINMMNEAGASQAALTLLAKDFVQSKKHRRFIDSITGRLSTFDCLDKAMSLPDPLQHLLQNSDLLERLELA
ncbi:ELM1/GtrOC1 family putative glycosyltransferase [Marinicella gelatinilytica]|uniref:ELM1/GtrOC1 family putative glycosyltransferase n=1 Tax=Marinicella gelatinilytica TaxID=2996017 RepID=UPI002260891D|nr:ELM1/GtrOC1 family putative glycosyltransferase [Marinicella gelatinilytica]MCX7545086.1 ELM1/GtrOC1 family putative glycosyltransferase [Marinicella gelatinilytica]